MFYIVDGIFVSKSSPSYLSKSELFGLSNVNRPILPETNKRFSNKELHGKWLPTILFCIYIISLWAPPWVPIPTMRWYMLLGLGALAFVVQNRRISIQASRLYWIVCGLSFYGAVFSLFRATDPDLSIQNTMGFAISIITFALFIPVLATRLARKALLIIIIVLGFLWFFEVRELINLYGIVTYSNFATEIQDDKNMCGMVMSFGGIALLYIAIFWPFARISSKLHAFFLRLLFVLGSFFLLANTVLIFARSGVISIVIGIIAILSVIFVKNPKKTRFLKIIFIIFIIFLIVFLFIDELTTISPKWEDTYKNLNTYGISTFDNG